MCLPALQDLREHFSSSRLTILARPAIAQLLSQQKEIDAVLVYDYQGVHKGILGLRKLTGEVRKREFDLAVLFQNAFEAAFIAMYARVPNRIGYSRDGRGWMLSHPVGQENGHSIHQIKYYQRLVQKITGIAISDRVPKLFVSSEEREACARRLLAFPQASETQFIGLNPGSVYGSAKRWPSGRFAEIGDELVNVLSRDVPGSSPVRCVLFGGAGEERLAGEIAQQMKTSPLILTGMTTIRELMVMLQRCRLLVTNDTGPMHMAQALGTPVVAIFGPTDPVATAPYGGENGIVRSFVRCSPCLLRSCPIDHRCMNQISVEQVVQVSVTQLRSFSGACIDTHCKG